MARGKKNPPNPILAAARAGTVDEAKAVEFLETYRWNGCPTCPRCESKAVYQMKDRATGGRNKDFRWRCRDCKRMFTVRTGTVFEETRLPLRIWVFALWKCAASKKGVSALQISRECEINYKSALFLMHRIRHATGALNGDGPRLSGTVEADETYVGGKPRGPKWTRKRGRGTSKVPVFGAVERDGSTRLRVVSRVNKAELGGALGDFVDPSSRLITDQFILYKHLGKNFAGGHETVNHSKREYARGDVHTNTIESVFASSSAACTGRSTA